MAVGVSIRSSVLLVGAAASWGVGTVISKQVLDELAPMALLTVQLTTSTVCSGSPVASHTHPDSLESAAVEGCQSWVPEPRTCLRFGFGWSDVHQCQHISAAVGGRAGAHSRARNCTSR